MPDIELMGATYPDVPAVDLPKSGGGTARFYDPNEILYAGSATSGGTAYKTEGIPFAAVDGTSTSTAFTVTVPGISELKDGTVMLLKNGVVTSASGFTINVNNLGAKQAYSNMAAASAETTLFNVNYTMLFVYDETRVAGGCWIMYRGYNSNDNTIGYQLRTNSTVMKTSDQSRYYRMFFTSADGTHMVPANTAKDNSATSTKTVNQRPINPFGRIIYYSYSTNLSAESDLGASYCWDQYTFSLGYSFNTTGSALTLTTKTPVYIKAAPQSDGSAIIDSTTPYVQSLPASEDGKIYIFLGIAYSATNIELQNKHPVYWYKDGMIRPYTNAPAGGAVSSVNGQTGAVVLDADDVGALPDSTTYVSSFNGNTGAVTYTAPVTSVNGSTGAVTVAGLPTVTSSDNGKVLMVQSGAWVVASLPIYNGGVS